MLAWGLPAGVGGACENTLIPEWRCPVKRLTQMTGQPGAACLNVPTSICDLHPTDFIFPSHRDMVLIRYYFDYESAQI